MDDPRIFGTAIPDVRGLSYRKDISMKYTIVFTHNPQDYFDGMEPGELAVYREVDADELSLSIAPMCADGYKAIVFPENF